MSYGRSHHFIPIMFPRCLAFLLAAGAAFSMVSGHAAPRPGIGGEYTAAINGGTFDTSGKFRLVLTRSGLGSVSLIAGDEPPCVVFVGFDDGTGQLIPRGGDPDMAVHLILIPNPDGSFTVKGDLEDDGKVFPIEATQAATASGDASGAHTFVLGTTATKTDLGSGTARVARNGRVSGVVHVGQHKPVSFGGRLTPDQKLPLAVRFGSSESSLTTDLTFGDGSTNGAATVHDEDVSTQGFFRRANYVPRAKPVLPPQNASDSRYTVLAALVDGQPGGSVNQLRNGRFTEVLFHGKPGFLRVARATGVVTGGTDEQTFRGVVMQDDNILAGVCNGTLEFNLSNLPGSSNTGTFDSAGLTKTGSGTLIVNEPGSTTGTVAPGVGVGTSGATTTTIFGAASGSLTIASGSRMINSGFDPIASGTLTLGGGVLTAGSISVASGSSDFRFGGGAVLTVGQGSLNMVGGLTPVLHVIPSASIAVVTQDNHLIVRDLAGVVQSLILSSEQVATLKAHAALDLGSISLEPVNRPDASTGAETEPSIEYTFTVEGQIFTVPLYFLAAPAGGFSLPSLTPPSSEP